MLAGGTPVAPFVAFPEADPNVALAPGQGLLAMPPPANHVANPDALAAWHSTAVYVTDSLFDAAHRLNLTTALAGAPDFHLLHVDPAGIDMTVRRRPATARRCPPRPVSPRSWWSRMGASRTGDRHSAAG